MEAAEHGNPNQYLKSDGQGGVLLLKDALRHAWALDKYKIRWTR